MIYDNNYDGDALRNWRLLYKISRSFSTDYRFGISEQGYHIYDSNYKNQLTIPREISSDLLDFNASFELFSELGAREYIISKKMYSIFKESGIRALDCEPVRIS